MQCTDRRVEDTAVGGLLEQITKMRADVSSRNPGED